MAIEMYNLSPDNHQKVQNENFPPQISIEPGLATVNTNLCWAACQYQVEQYLKPAKTFCSIVSAYLLYTEQNQPMDCCAGVTNGGVSAILQNDACLRTAVAANEISDLTRDPRFNFHQCAEYFVSNIAAARDLLHKCINDDSKPILILATIPGSVTQHFLLLVGYRVMIEPSSQDVKDIVAIYDPSVGDITYGPLNVGTWNRVWSFS